MRNREAHPTKSIWVHNLVNTAIYTKFCIQSLRKYPVRHSLQSRWWLKQAPSTGIIKPGQTLTSQYCIQAIRLYNPNLTIPNTITMSTQNFHQSQQMFISS